MSKATKWSLWLFVNAIMCAVPCGVLLLLDSDLQRAHQLDPSHPTNGDSLGVPVFGAAIVTFHLLVALVWCLLRQCKTRTMCDYAPISRSE